MITKNCFIYMFCIFASHLVLSRVTWACRLFVNNTSNLCRRHLYILLMVVSINNSIAMFFRGSWCRILIHFLYNILFCLLVISSSRQLGCRKCRSTIISCSSWPDAAPNYVTISLYLCCNIYLFIYVLTFLITLRLLSAKKWDTDKILMWTWTLFVW